MSGNKCQSHHRYFYAGGIIGWCLVMGFLFHGFAYESRVLWAAHAFCFSTLAINMWLQHREPDTPKDYEMAEKVYEYVERNTYYLIMAITIFLLISSNGHEIFKGSNVDFRLIVYAQAAAMTFCVTIIALFWMPASDEKKDWLVNLKHLKTVMHIYALSLFFIGPIEVISKLRNTF